MEASEPDVITVDSHPTDALVIIDGNDGGAPGTDAIDPMELDTGPEGGLPEVEPDAIPAGASDADTTKTESDVTPRDALTDSEGTDRDSADGTDGIDGDPPAVSCAALHARSPSLPSGRYTVDFDGPGASRPTSVYCDMVTGGGGWTLVAASAGANNMPKFLTVAVMPCTEAAPLAPCFIGARNLGNLSFTEVAWSTAAAAVHTTQPIDEMLAGAPEVNAICINDTEYFRFNQDIAEQGMGWTGCVPTEWFFSLAFCDKTAGRVWNLLTCAGLVPTPDSRSSPDYDCSPFGEINAVPPANVCRDFRNMRHWRR